MNAFRLSIWILAIVLPVTALVAQDAPPGLEGIEIIQKLDESIPEDLEFRDSTGRPVNLREISAGRPMLLALVYYECPMLCTQVLTLCSPSTRTCSALPPPSRRPSLSTPPAEGGASGSGGGSIRCR